MRPMLAGPYVPEHIRYPVIVQPKLDGIRAIVQNGLLYSRNERAIPNAFIQASMARFVDRTEGLDGELMVGDPTAEDAYRKTDSGVMSRHGEPDFRYMVFDWADPTSTLGYADRRRYMLEQAIGIPRCEIVWQYMANNEDELLQYESNMIEQGYEGVILRDPEGLYKQGRSTSRQGYLIKLKRFQDSEAIISGFEELMSNQNEKKVGAHGLTERTSHRANMVPMDTLGAMICTDCETGLSFRIGSFKGLDLQQRQAIWNNRTYYMGQKIVYKYQKVGGYDLPRFPIFKGWRNDL